MVSITRRSMTTGALLLTVVAAAPMALAQASAPRIATTGDRTADVRSEVRGGTARNVILFIGDGMGDSEITAARNYAMGAAGRLELDKLPMTGAYTTYSVTKNDPSKPVYVTDSAASGTGWATGTKSYNGAIGVDAYGNARPSMLELAKRGGYRTGDVSTASIQDATPAVQGTHVADRGCFGPDTMAKCPKQAKENGGPGSISEQLVQTGADVVLGGGAESFAQKVRAGKFKGRTVLDQAKASGYQTVSSGDQLAAANGRRPLLGLFAKGDMDVEWSGPKAKLGGTSPQRCQPNASRDAKQPHLTDMTTKAIDVLDQGSRGRDKGFFLQVEGASIDKQDHAADPCGQIGENVAFDQAVAAGMAYARSHGDTLVVVTADHGHTSQIISDNKDRPGMTATLITRDNAEMTMSYATKPSGVSQDHTGTEVRIAGYGPQAANVTGVTDQTELFDTVTRALRVR